jgi:uncharacterized repeat protein (TIGR01451 family)
MRESYFLFRSHVRACRERAKGLAWRLKQTGMRLISADTRWSGVVLLTLAAVAAAPAQAAYKQVYGTIQKGALTFTGNTLMLNGTAGGSGNPGVAGTAVGTGGAFIAAGSATQCGTFPVGTTCAWASNASSAVLNIPPGATILHAELIWSGTVGTTAGTQLSAAQMNSAVTFATPASSGQSITPSLATAAVDAQGLFYTRSANVTGYVQLARAGTYAVRAVPAGSSAGQLDAAGWTLAVAYADASQPARNLTIFVGSEAAVNGVAAVVSGFCTPVAGPLTGRLLVSAVEGDSALTGDTMRFGPTAASMVSLQGFNNVVDNFFASQINGNTGTLDTSGTFGSTNSVPGAVSTPAARQGYDITNVDASSRLINSQTSGYAQGTTTGENYSVNALALQINVASPIFPVAVKSVNKTSTFVGDTLRYTINLDNTAGNGPANNVIFYDTLPPGMALVPNSVTVGSVARPGADPAAGVPLNPIAQGSAVTVAFDVTVVSLPASPALPKFDNAARWTYTYDACVGVVNQAGQVATNAVSTPIPRLEPVKSVSPTGQLIAGQLASYTISIPNTGALDTAGSTLADPIPAGTVYVAGSTRLNGATVPDLPGGVMPFATAALVNSPGKAAGVVAFGAAATVQFQVVAQTGGTVTNVATIDPDGAGPGTAIVVSVNNTGLTGPTVAKAFLPASISAGGVSRLTVTLSNPNASAITGVAGSDNLPSGMVIATPANGATTCTGATVVATASSAKLAMSGASIPASGSCTFAADVSVAAAGSYTNTIPPGAMSSGNAGLSTAVSQVLTVTPAPSISKSFQPATVAPTVQPSSLSITLTNPTASAMTAVTFTDTFPGTAAGAPGNMTLFDTVTSTTCGGSLTDGAGAALAVGSASVKLSGATIAANGVCVITVNVKAPNGGTYANTIAAGALSSSAGSNTVAALASLQVASPQVTKSFGVRVVPSNASALMTITLTNITGTALTTLAFTDTYPRDLVNSSTTVTTNTCGGPATASAATTNPGTLTLSGGSLLAGASCTLAVNVQSAVKGSYTNTIAAGAVTSSLGANAVAASDILNVDLPDITKVFSAPTVALSGTATLTMTLTNPTNATMTGAAFTDTLPAGLVSSAAAGSCVGSKVANGATVSLSGGSIPAKGSCTVTATVTGTSFGIKTNTIAVGDLTVLTPAAVANGEATTASITVLAPPSITKVFLASPILPNTGTSTLQFVLSNNNPVALTGVVFTDTFPTAPGAMTLANLTTTNDCGGTLQNNLGAALAIGSAGIRLNGGVIAANGGCTITVNVKAAVAGDYTNTIAAGALNSTEAGNSTVTANAALAVRLAAPTLAKSFGPSTIAGNSATTLLLTLTNPSTTQTINGAALSDIFPAGMKVFSTPAFSNTCGGTVTSGSAAGDGAFGMSGATIPFNTAGTASCSISVQVTSSVVAASPGVTNTTGTVTSTNASTSATASANLIVTPAPLTAPGIVKSFGPASMGSGDISTIIFNLGSANTGILTNANFTDALVNMTVASATIGGTCAGVINSPALAVGASALNLTVPNLAPGGCSVTVQVTSSHVGVNPNSVSGVTSTQTPSAGAGAGPVNLTVYAKPTVGKVFGTPTIAVGGTSTLIFTLGNTNSTALTNATFTDTLTDMSISSTAITGSCSAVVNTPALVVGATGTNALSFNVPNLPAGGCTVIVNVTSTVPGIHPNSVSGVASTQTPIPGVGAGPVNLTVTGGDISGTVYVDANHNGQKDGGDTVPGLTLYAKLVSAASPTGPALQAVAVNSATGAYQFLVVSAGTYTVLIDDNNTLADVTPTLATNWIGTETPNQIRSNVVVAGNPLSNLNFGLFNGNMLTGRVFTDNGIGAGTANDGLQNGTEAGLASVVVKLTDASGATTYDSTSTDASGNYVLWIPSAISGGSLKLVETNPSGYLSTGGTVGNSAGTYSRAATTTTFTYSTGTSYSGVNFGLVPPNTLAPNGAQSAQPATVVFYAHTFQAGSAGQVTFSLANIATPSSPAWSQVLYQDSNCDGVLDAAEPLVTAPVSVTAGQKLCLIVKQFVPAGAALGAQNSVTLSAAFSYTGASPALSSTLTATDITTVGAPGELALTKLVSNLTQGSAAATAVNAKPSDILQYTLTAVNNGTQALNATAISPLRVSDATPAFTTYVGASAFCPVTLPAGLICTAVSAPGAGAPGALQWTFAGALAPSAQFSVTYQVKVDQ